uniref:DUF1064 domain-containing protein n=1 Tax=viral metagenome TaxID=1070528 RepID=A0A6M3LAR9_9ZZZZ
MTLPYSDVVLKLNPGLAQMKTVPASKYHNARTEASGMTFQSGREAVGVSKLILLEQAKQIFALRLQVRFPLQGNTSYIADAVYLDDKLAVHVVDFKGFKTPEYKLKKKLFKEKYGIDIEEV